MPPKRIAALTDEHRALFPAIVEEWTAVGLSTERANRAEAERGVALAYGAAGLEPPKACIWVPSPMGSAILSSGVGDGVGNGVRDGVWAGVWAGVRDGVWDGVWAGVWAGVRDGVWDGVRDGVGNGVWDGVWAGVWAGVGNGVRDGVWDGVRDGVWANWYRDAIYGQHDAAWLAHFDAFARLGLHDITAPLDGLMLVARNAGWWWAFRDVAILTDRPLAVHVERDARGVNRLHCETGPAIVYCDGWGVWSWHGTRVPADVIETPPDEITRERILDERNAEVRRVLTERVGVERLAALLGSEIVATDDWGTLHRIARPDEDPMMVVELVNSTPEPDGTSKHYWIRVPGTIERLADDRCLACGTSLAIVPATPHQAVAWGYGLCASDYAPAVMS